MDKKQVKKIADQEVKAHEKRMHKGKGMAKGGVTTDQMKKLGRNLARVANQKSG